MPNFANAQDLVAVDQIKEGVVLSKNGSLHQIVMVGGINFSLKSDQEQGLIVAAYQNFLNSLNFPLQIIVHSRKINIERYLSGLEERKNQEVSGLLQDQISEYQSFIRQFVSENAIMAKTFLVVVSFYPVSVPVPTGKIFGFLPFGKKPQDKTGEDEEKNAMLKENLTQLSQRANQVTDGLRAIGLETLVLNDEQLTELFYNFYNPETVEKEKAK